MNTRVHLPMRQALALARRSVSALVRDGRAVTAIEYAVIGSLIIAVCAAAIGTVGGQVEGMFAQISAAFP